MPRRILGLLLALPLLPLLAAGAAGQDAAGKSARDWPQWRGPNRDAVSHETGLLQEWPRGGPPLVWRRAELGGGFGSPAIANGRIYGLSYRGDDEVVWALDEATGAPAWATRIAAKGKPWPAEGPRSTPTVAGGRVYAVGTSGDLACLDAATGAAVWAKNYERDFGGRLMSGWGFSESPLVDGGRVICTPGADDAALAALDAATGRVVWKAAVSNGGGAGYSSVMPAQVGGVRLYVTLLGNKVVGVAAKDGKLLWESERPTGDTANIPTVIVKDDLVLASTGYADGGVTLFRLSAAGGRVTAAPVYDLAARVARNHHGGMVLVGGHVYFGEGQNDGTPTCLELATGKVAWQQAHSPGEGSAAVLAYGDRVVFRYDDGTVALVAASPTGYKLVSSFKQPDRSPQAAWAHPALADGKLYLRDQGVLLCYDVRKRK
jgi:outer membrane protein assembly factor BamB